MADADARRRHTSCESRATEEIAVRRAERWAAVVPSEADVDVVNPPSPEEARAAVLAHRGGADAFDGLQGDAAPTRSL